MAGLGAGTLEGEVLQILFIVSLGLAAGVLVGLTGIGGGIIIVPTLVHLLKMDQHMAQGTSLFLLLPPSGIGALYLYWKRGEVDLRAGLLCAAGIFFGGLFGGLVAVRIPSLVLRAIFGLFLMISSVPLWRRTSEEPEVEKGNA